MMPALLMDLRMISTFWTFDLMRARMASPSLNEELGWIPAKSSKISHQERDATLQA
jgi:hypothetical protein